MGLLAATPKVYYTFCDEPVSGSRECDNRITDFLKRLKESSWFEASCKNVSLESLSLNINVIELFMFATNPDEVISDEGHELIQQGMRYRKSRVHQCVCPGCFLFLASAMTSASIGLCYFFTKDSVNINTLEMTLIFSLTALASLMTSWLVMYVVTTRRANKLAEMSSKELSFWDQFEQNHIKSAAREWLKLFNPQAQAGESHSKFQNRRRAAMVIYEHLKPETLREDFKKLTTYHDKISQIFSHFQEARSIIERQTAFEVLNLEMISPEHLHYNLTGSEVGLYAAQLHYFKKVNNRWEI